jgi:hypothetical protein
VSSTDDQMIADYLGRLAEAAAILPPDRRAELIDEITTHIAEARAAQAAAEDGTPGTVATVLERLGRPQDIAQAAADQGETGTESGTLAPGVGSSEHSPSGYSPSGCGPPGFGQPSYSPGQPHYGPGQPSYSPGQPHYGPGQPTYDPSQPDYSSGGGWAGPPSGWQGPGGYGPNRPDHAGQALGWMEVVAIVLLLIGGFLAGIGWVAGVILLWLSPRWRVSDKLLGTLVWPGGLAAIMLVLGAAAVLPTRVSSCSGTAPNCGGAHPGWQLLAILVILIGLAGPIMVTLRLVRQARRWAGEVPGDPAAGQLAVSRSQAGQPPG